MWEGVLIYALVCNFSYFLKYVENSSLTRVGSLCGRAKSDHYWHPVAISRHCGRPTVKQRAHTNGLKMLSQYSPPRHCLYPPLSCPPWPPPPPDPFSSNSLYTQHISPTWHLGAVSFNDYLVNTTGHTKKTTCQGNASQQNLDRVSGSRRETMVRLHKAEVMIAGEQLRYGEKDEEKGILRYLM